MKVKILLLLLISVLAIAAIAVFYNRSRPPAETAIKESEVLKYEPIDFEEILTKPKVVPISTERDPFKSPLEDLKVLAMAGEGQAQVSLTESLKLTGIINGPDGPVALIKTAPEEKTHAVKPNSTIGKFYIKRITDNEVILTVNGIKAVLRLGGGEK